MTYVDYEPPFGLQMNEVSIRPFPYFDVSPVKNRPMFLEEIASLLCIRIQMADAVIA